MFNTQSKIIKIEILNDLLLSFIGKFLKYFIYSIHLLSLSNIKYVLKK